jgi:two-component system cell cycle sensor histidine kinase/response regulator CckA
MVSTSIDRQKLASEVATLRQRVAELEKKEAEYNLAEERHRTVFESANDILILIDKRGKILDVNEKIKDIGGYEREELLGKSVRSLTKIMTKKSLAIIVKNFMKRMTGINILPYEVEMVRKDGQVATVEISAVAMKRNGKIVGDLAILRDTTERKRAEERVQESEQRYRSLFDNAHDMIQSVALDGSIILANRAWMDTLGYTEPELPGLNLFNIIHPDSQAHCMELFSKVMSGESVDNIETTFIAKDGRSIHVEGTAAPRRLGDEIISSQGIFRDVTERKAAEEELRKTEEQLRQAQKMEAIGRLAGGVAHDFNNLLTVITVSTDILLREMGEDDTKLQDIQEIKKAAERAASLTRQLLVFSRRQVVEPEVLDLNTVISDMDKMLPRILGEDIQLETVLETELQAVKVDRANMEQVIMNLIVNARDAMPDGGSLVVRTENVSFGEGDNPGITEAKAGRFVRLSVTDNGTGMSKEIVEHIFEPFFTTKAKGKGTGLGLSTVYGIIKQSKGWINVYSEPGRGSTFKIYLPVFSSGFEGKHRREAEVSTVEGLNGNGERILLVEDEEPIRVNAQRLLSEHGYLVSSAESAEEALTIFDTEKSNFELLISDVVLPGKSGVELAEQLLTLHPELQVVLSSGYADEKSRWSAISDRGYPFLQKPYTAEKLLRIVKETIARSRTG